MNSPRIGRLIHCWRQQHHIDPDASVSGDLICRGIVPSIKSGNLHLFNPGMSLRKSKMLLSIEEVQHA